MINSNVNENYDSSSIQVLEGLMPVRVRPAMYIGSVGSKGLHHLIWEIIDNSVDEYLVGVCDTIHVKMCSNGFIEVRDNGRGVPVDVHPQKKIPTERVIFTVLHAGGKFGSGAYKTSGGLHGVGSSVVNALSTRFEVEVYQDGKKYTDIFENGGNPIVELNKDNTLPYEICDKSLRGTTVRFKPDETIFDTVKFKEDIILGRLKELGYLNSKLTIYFENEYTGNKITIQERDGLVGYIKDINESSEVETPIISVKGENNGISFELALQYIKDNSEKIFSFCNNINTHEGGTHVSALKSGTTRMFNKYARELGILKEKEDNLDGKDVRSGMVAIISVGHPDPQYEGQTKTKLNNADVRTSIEEAMVRELELKLDSDVNTLNKILDLIMKSRQLRRAEEKVRDNFLKDTKKKLLNTKVSGCQSKNPREKEIFLVEGSSAGGSAKQARDRYYQSILCLKGKTVNPEKNSLDSVIANEEIQNMISEFGVGIENVAGFDFDLEKRNYDKIILATDADVDGRHINTLLISFFHRYMRPLIVNGNIYLAVSPLFKIVNKNNKKIFKYLYSDKEMEREVEEYKEKGIAFELQRYKG